MVEKNLDQVRGRIAAAARAAGRDPSSIRLICVTKGIPVDVIRQAVACGVSDLGENRVQEADEKQRLFGHDRYIRWHMIGHLQRNKVKEALEIFDLIHSVDRLELAESIQRSAEAMKRSVDLLVQVNAARIESRFGASIEETPALVEKIRRFDRLRVRGLMTMAPYADDPETARPIFRRVKQLAAELNLTELSMGMSSDFEAAVQEGATMVRIGTAVFKQ